MSGDALISFEEAEDLGHAEAKRPIVGSRIVLIGVTGLLAVIVFTLLVMTLLSLRGARTGLSTIFPFLDNQSTRTLQVN